MDMDAYLSSIDTFMKQRQEEEQGQQASQDPQFTQPLPDHLNDIWVDNLPNLIGDLLQQPTMNIPQYPTSFTPYPQPVAQNYLLDMYGQPIRPRKKPGRKPNPTSPAVRKAQNRAAQRAFRERKERHLKDLENTIHRLKEQRARITKQLDTTRKELLSSKVENWYLKGVVLTLQFICLQNNLNIPTHAPYISDKDLNQLAHGAPYAIDAYINAYTRNNESLKSSISAITQQHIQDKKEQETSIDDEPELLQQEHEQEQQQQQEEEEQLSVSDIIPMDETKMDQEQLDKEASLSPMPDLQDDLPTDITSSIEAIQYIRLKLGHKHVIDESIKDISAARLKPTVLQMAIPHDPRIDLVPTPHTRDRMILFGDQMDYDRCFSLLLDKAVYHGGDPTLSESWEMPPDFFSEYWYLTLGYDVNKTNKWRRLKGLPDLSIGPRAAKDSWNLEALVSTLSTDALTDDKDKPEYYYERLFGNTPNTRMPITSPTFQNFIDYLKML